MSDISNDSTNAPFHKTKLHDYTRPKWGHSLTFYSRSDDGSKYLVLGFNQGKVVTGDQFIIGGKSGGTSRYKVMSIEWKSDPHDMFEAEIEHIPGMTCNQCKTWFAADDPRIQAGTCPICEGGK